MESPALGIDLGTTNSVVAVADGRESRVLSDSDGRRLVPSVVSFHPDGSILVGHDARERRLVDAPNTVYSIKRLIGRPFDSPEVARARERLAFALEATPAGGVQVRVRRGSFALPEISAMVLRHLRTMAEASLGTTCKQAVITVPANFNELQRSATQAAGKVAGLEVLRILNEPTAATLAYGYGREKAESIAVYDLGGGTFDLTVLDLDKDVFEVVSTAGDTFLGGDDLDVLVADRMCNQCLKEHRYDPKSDPQTYERLRAAAEWAKCQLSAVTDVDVTIEELFQDGRGRTIDFSFHLTRDELESLAKPLVARSFDVVADALRAAGRRPKEIQSVVLVGGSTRIPLVRRMVAEHFGREPKADIDPDLVVAQGAAIHAFTLRGQQQASGSAAKALARAAAPKMPMPKGTPMARVALRRQPAFAPEDPRDAPISDERTRVAGAVPTAPLAATPTRAAPVPKPDEVTRIAAAPTGPTRAPVVEEPTRIAPAPEPSARRAARGGTSPAGIAPAARVEPPSPPARPVPPPPKAPDDEMEDEATLIGKRPVIAPGPELSTPFFEVPSSVAVMPARTVGVGTPAKPAPAPITPPTTSASLPPGLMDLDPVDLPMPKPRVREPTMQLAGGRAIPVGSAPTAAAPEPTGPARAPTGMGTGPVRAPTNAGTTGPMRAPTGAGTGPVRAPTGTWALGDQDISPVTSPPTPQRPVPPPGPPAPPPARPADREKIQQALFGGKPSPFAEVDPFAAPAAPAPASVRPPAPPPPPSPPGPAYAPDPASAPGMSWSDFDVASLPDAQAPLSTSGFGVPPTMPLPVPVAPMGAPAMAPPMQAAPSPQAVAPRQPVVAMPNRPAPLLMDVTPLALGLETAGGYVQQLVARNAPIPTEKTRVFSTGRDDQTTVEVRICQGDSNLYQQNQPLGSVTLDALRKARRGEIRIEVTFMIDASGILDVKATDLDTKRVQAIRIALKGGASDQEVEAMRQRQAQLFPGG